MYSSLQSLYFGCIVLCCTVLFTSESMQNVCILDVQTGKAASALASESTHRQPLTTLLALVQSVCMVTSFRPSSSPPSLSLFPHITITITITLDLTQVLSRVSHPDKTLLYLNENGHVESATRTFYCSLFPSIGNETAVWQC